MTITIPTMPATNCPAWCEQDHAAREWQMGVESCELLAAEGMHRDPAKTFEPLHERRLLDLQVEGAGHGVELDWQAGTGEEPSLWIDANGPLTAAQARELASALLSAVEGA